MYIQALSKSLPRSSWLPAGTLLFVGAVIASMAGFDIVFNAITGDMPWIRVVLFLALTSLGIFFAQRTGLRLASHDLSHPIAVAFGIGLLVAIYIATIDVVVFRHLLPPRYVAYFSELTLSERMIYFMLRAFNENILYRLFLMSALVWGIGLAWRDSQGLPPKTAYWIAIVLAQAIPMLLNEASFYPPHITPFFLLYVAVRFILAGILWGFLYWRYGFVMAETAHVSTHIFLQPILGYVMV
ncbi:hypothetical protein AB4Z35_29415 [Pseudomonas sp. KB_15]|uniref:hypothetical protein n=1 Tax=Pseudomonas sp. KB_15 TaxID=3233035 RepID=UPI003F94A17A